MNYLKVIAKNDFLEYKQLFTFDFVSDNINIQITDHDNTYLLLLSSKKKINTIKKKFDDIYNFMFLLLGYFPLIESYQINGAVLDTSSFVLKYKTSSQFIKSYSALCKINSQNINEVSLSKFTSFVHRRTLTSLEYLTCAEYEHMVSEHKVVLLLHTIDGFIKNTYIEDELLKEVKKIYKNPEVRYEKRVRRVFETFFYYHRKYNCGILQLLGVSRNKFIEKISDTRNGLSHLIDKSEQLTKGDLILRYFFITVYSLRLFIINELRLHTIDDNIKENLFVYHDWIAEHKYGDKAKLKSITYNQNKAISEMVKMFEAVQKNN